MEVAAEVAEASGMEAVAAALGKGAAAAAAAAVAAAVAVAAAPTAVAAVVVPEDAVESTADASVEPLVEAEVQVRVTPVQP